MKQINLIAGLLVAMTGLTGADTGAPAEQNFIINTESVADKQARMAWWKEARFGMFVHWGLYSTAEGEWNGKVYGGGVEWIQKRANVPADIYEKTMLPQFKPSTDFASQWARLAKQAGAKYVVFTSKHHEGFALHDSAQTKFDAKDVTGRDLYKEIVDAIRGEGLAVGVYHSLWDWHHPDAPAGQGSINVNGLSMEGRELPRYVDYLHSQVNEQTDGRYGPVDILWLDYSKNQFKGAVWRASDLVKFVRENQPQILINNRLWNNEVKGVDEYKKYWFGDFTTPEQHIPATGIEGIDWETCDTLNGTWGWSKHATTFKSSEQLIHRLVDAVSKGGNYLLNIGPLPDGSIDPTTMERFEDLGKWMEINGEAIYGTQAGPFTRLPWGRATAKDMGDGISRLYLHVFDWPADGELFVPGLKTMPVHGFLIDGSGGQDILSVNDDGKIIIKGLPIQSVHEAATVIALDFNQKPDAAPYRVYASTDGTFSLEPADAVVQGAKYHDHHLRRRSCLDSWEASGHAAYPLQVENARTYEVEIDVATDKLDEGDTFMFYAGNEKVPLTLKSTGGSDKWKVLEAAAIRLPAGATEFKLRCETRQGDAQISFSTITLKPVD